MCTAWVMQEELLGQTSERMKLQACYAAQHVITAENFQAHEVTFARIVQDRSFTFIMKTPPASVLLKKAAKIDRGSGEPKDVKVGKITQEQLRASFETDCNTSCMQSSIMLLFNILDDSSLASFTMLDADQTTVNPAIHSSCAVI